LVLILTFQLDQFPRFLYWQWSQYYTIQKAKDSSVGSNAQSER